MRNNSNQQITRGQILMGKKALESMNTNQNNSFLDHFYLKDALDTIIKLYLWLG